MRPQHHTSGPAHTRHGLLTRMEHPLSRASRIKRREAAIPRENADFDPSAFGRFDLRK